MGHAGQRPTLGDKLKIGNYLQTHRAKLLEQRPGWAELSSMLVKEFGIGKQEGQLTVRPPESTCRQVAKEAGIIWTPTNTGGHEPGKWHRMNKVEAICQVLIRELVKLRQQVGVTDPLSPELQALYDATMDGGDSE